MIKKYNVLLAESASKRDFTVCHTEPKAGFHASTQQLEHIQLNGSYRVQGIIQAFHPHLLEGAAVCEMNSHMNSRMGRSVLGNATIDLWKVLKMTISTGKFLTSPVPSELCLQLTRVWCSLLQVCPSLLDFKSHSVL